MNNRLTCIPDAAKDAADRGELIAAIQITQDTLGMKLSEAQQAVHAYMRGASRDAAPSFAHRVPPQALASLRRGNLIEAIKHTRDATGLGLKEAKDTVEAYLAQNPHARQQFDTSTRGNVNLAPLIAGFVVAVLIAVATYVLSKGNGP